MKHEKKFNAAGVTFNGRQGLLCNLMKSTDAKLSLIREPDNPYDANAIKILANTGKRYPVGYVPKAVAAEMAPIMDSGKFVRIDRFAVVGGGRNRSYGLTLETSYIA